MCCLIAVSDALVLSNFCEIQTKEVHIKRSHKSEVDAKEVTRVVHHCWWRGKPKRTVAYQHDSLTCWWKNKAVLGWLIS